MTKLSASDASGRSSHDSYLHEALSPPSKFMPDERKELAPGVCTRFVCEFVQVQLPMSSSQRGESEGKRVRACDAIASSVN